MPAHRCTSSATSIASDASVGLRVGPLGGINRIVEGRLDQDRPFHRRGCARALPAALSSPSVAVRFFPAPICQPSDSFFPLSLSPLPLLFPIPRHAAFLLTRVAKFFNDRSIVPRRAPAPRRGKLSLRLNDFPGKRHG